MIVIMLLEFGIFFVYKIRKMLNYTNDKCDVQLIDKFAKGQEEDIRHLRL